MKGVLTIDEKIQSFDEKAIRQIVTEVLLNTDGIVNVKFKHQEAIEAVERYTMKGEHSQEEKSCPPPC